KLLSESERSVLYRLSVFVTPLTPEAAQRIAKDAVLTEGQVATAIASLADKSLLSSSMLNGKRHLRLLDSTRTYAWEKLVESGELNAVLRKLTEYFIAQLRRSSERENERQAAGGDAADGDNMRPALFWSFSE